MSKKVKNLATVHRVQEQVFNNMREKTFHAIVNRAFMEAIPINRSELDKDSVKAISEYSKNALEAAGGYSLLERAIENCTEPAKKAFLEDIKDVCETSANMVALRVAKEAELTFGGSKPVDPSKVSDPDNEDSDDNTNDTESDNDTSDDNDTTEENEDTDDENDEEEDDDEETIDDIKSPDDTKPVPIKPQVIRQGVAFKDLVADARMTDEEYERYVRMRGKLDLPEVSKIINHKVEQAMKAEKETYQMIDEADQKLKDAITDKAQDEGEVLTDDQADEIKESMLYIPLKNKQREHVSVFSKIQAAAIESCLSKSNINTEVVDPDLMLDVTARYTFDIFDTSKLPEKTIEQTLDNLVNFKVATEACDNPMCQNELMNLGTAFATIIYTFLQALNTMNLTKFTPAMARNLCCKNGPLCDNRPGDVSRTIDTKVSAALEDKAKAIRKMNYAPQIENAIADIAKFKDKLMGVKESGINVNKILFAKIDNLTNEALNRKADLEAGFESSLAPQASMVTNRMFETDKCQMGRLKNSFRNANIDKITFKCTEGASVIDVIGMKNNHPVKSTSIVLESSYNVPTDKYLKMLVKSSPLNDAKFGNELPAIESWIDGKHTNLR